MHRTSLRQSGWSLVATSLLAALASGCHDGQSSCSCNDIPAGAIPQPNGNFACQWTNAERCRAEQDQFVIYLYEWSPEPAMLTVGGLEHVTRMAHSLGQTPYSVIIETSQDRSVDERRRVAVLEALADAGCPTDPARVICGRPEAEGLYGQEAPGVAGRMLTNQGGQGGGGGGFGGSQGGIGSSGGLGTSSGIGSGGGMGIY